MPWKDPAKRRVYLAKWHAKHRARINAKHRERWPAYYAANREKKLAYNKAKIARKASRPKPDICEICASPPNAWGLHLDHSHQTGLFRGWICQNCNLALGLVHDSAQHLRKLIAYLEQHKSGEAPQRSLPGI